MVPCLTFPSLQAEAICRPHWLQAKENTCEWICSSSATMARAYLVLMTIQAVGLRLCVTQVPDLDFVVIGGGSKDALAKKDVLDISSSPSPSPSSSPSSPSSPSPSQNRHDDLTSAVGWNLTIDTLSPCAAKVFAGSFTF